MGAEVSHYYVDEYAELREALAGSGESWVREMRDSALARFAESGFPSPRDEEWKYTNVSAMERKRFLPVAGASGPGRVEPSLLQRLVVDGAMVLVFVDGRYSAQHSVLRTGLSDGVVIEPMSQALQTRPELIRPHLGRAVDSAAHGFTDFNTAMFNDGVFIRVPRGVQLDFPVQLLSVSASDEALSVSRNLLVADPDSAVEVFETFAASGDPGGLTASVSEVVAGDNATVNWTRLQCESSRNFHFGGLYALQSAGGRLNHCSYSFGGLLVRNEVHTDLARAAEAHLHGAFLGTRRQHVDNHTRIRHREPQAISREFYKGIMDQRARGVFQGRIIVDQDAQHTDSEMNNRNLLLSEDAEVDSKPQLEIYADDVKCAHGVTVGQLDAESIFYLRSRGVDEAAARELLTFAFINEMVGRVDHEAVRRCVESELQAYLPQALPDGGRS